LWAKAISNFFLRFDSCTFLCNNSLLYFYCTLRIWNHIIFLDRSDGLCQYPLFFLTALYFCLDLLCSLTWFIIPFYLPLAEFDVGLITVDMSINVTYPNLKPHLHELAELIAKELEIDSRQVRMKYIMWLFGWASYASSSFSVKSECLGIIISSTSVCANLIAVWRLFHGALAEVDP